MEEESDLIKGLKELKNIPSKRTFVIDTLGSGWVENKTSSEESDLDYKVHNIVDKPDLIILAHDMGMVRHLQESKHLMNLNKNVLIVTDTNQVERERGITISSIAEPFPFSKMIIKPNPVEKPPAQILMNRSQKRKAKKNKSQKRK